MPIRLKPKDKERVRIQPEFLKEVLILRERHSIKLGRRYRRIANQLKDPHLDGWDRTQLEKEFQSVKYTQQLMNPRGEGLKAGRGGDDYEITRLRKLPYLRLMVIKRQEEGTRFGKEQTWLVGETPKFRGEVVSDPWWYADMPGHEANFDNVCYNGIYEHGPYLICILTTSFGTTDPIWHILPKDMPRVRNRHLHASDKRISVLASEGSHNPLDGKQVTCWGKFAGIAHAQCEGWNVPSLFGALFQFAEKLCLDSMLNNIERCPNIKLIKRL